jgi:pyruvate formate lyase activating enzyme
MQEARLYKKRDKKRVDCFLCHHSCSIANHRRGLCGVRENQNGVLYSLVYGKIVAENVDPVEKKPLFHFQPESRTFSISTVGCNFSCRHCQNASISQPGSFSADAVPGHSRTPEDIVESTLSTACQSISYTYVEPTIFFEFAYDCMEVAGKAGLKNIFVSNGYMSAEATELLVPRLDAINIDLKAFSDDFYKSVCGARLQPVLDTIKRMYEAGIWVEVTTLLIPGLNDSEEELQQIADFLVSLDTSIPWHVTGFYPTYKLTDRPATTPASLDKALQIGIRTGLQYVYAGNRPESGGENTHCPSCGLELISRYGFSIQKNNLIQGKCPSCKSPIAGIWG